jgi:2-C-methyl-D-erythritol 4-phosphate cytidylyltransferase
MRVIALIPAAGMGRRMNAGINKQYLKLDGMPIVARTIEVFDEAPFVDDIYVITPEDEIPFCREHVVDKYSYIKVRDVVPGGKERQNSVMNGLRAIRSPEPGDIVVIHDGVRPFITVAIIEQSIEAARTHGGAVVAVPAKDTIKIVRDNIVRETPPRETLWQAQTPQTFRYDIIMHAHERAEAEGFLGTDDSSLVERVGGTVALVMGDYRNIKITTPEDMQLAHSILDSFEDHH